MLFLVTVLVGDLALVFFGSIHVTVLIAVIEDINDVDSEGGGRALSSSFLVSVATVLLLLLPSSPKVFKTIRVLGS